jgi:hypothetical protein
MAKSQVRRIVIREWMSLARDKRSTHDQAVAFAKAVVQRSRLPASRQDPYKVVMGWLLPRTGKS